MNFMSRFAALLFLSAATALAAQQPAFPPTTAATAATRDTSYIDAQGTAHITRIVPIPSTVSPQARLFLSRAEPDQAPPESLAHRRSRTDAWAITAAAAWSKLCPNKLVNTTIAGVPVRIVTPDNMPAANRGKVLLNLHGGGFNSDSGSYTETIPIAGYSRIKVVSPLYRLAPEHPFPAAVDDSVAVYKELLKSYKPSHIIIYGTSAGAILTGEVAVRLKQLGLPEPAALGIFSGRGDFAHQGDSASFFALRGLAGPLSPPSANLPDPGYVGTANRKNPVLSPSYADLHGLPPTLFVSSTRDMLLSGTANLERAFIRDGVDCRMVVFDALPHAFWYDPKLPESIEANHIMAAFFVKQLSK